MTTAGPRMYYPFVMYAGMPPRVRWRLAWRITRILNKPERASLHPAAASASMIVIMDFMDADRLYHGQPTVLQQYRPRGGG